MSRRFDQVASRRANAPPAATRVAIGLRHTDVSPRVAISNDWQGAIALGLRYVQKSVVTDATYPDLLNPVGNAVKNSFGFAVADGGGGAENYVPHLPEYVGKANGVDMTPAKLRKS